MTYIAKYGRINKIPVCIGSTPAPSTLRIRNKLFYMMLRIFLFMKNILQSFLVKKSMV